MYINPFIAGVLATVLAEALIIIGIALFMKKGEKHGKN